MVVPLNQLLGRAKRPIVVDGELLRCDGFRVVASLYEGYSTLYEKVTRSGVFETIPPAKADKLIVERLSAFEAKYPGIAPSNKAGSEGDDNDSTAQVLSYVDLYTGAIIIESPAYTELKQPKNHDVSNQPPPRVRAMLTEFIKEYTFNYMDLYLSLLNKRVASYHSPVIVRAHLVAGFFQPLIVECLGITSPFEYGENQWFAEMFSEYSKYLVQDGDSSRGLTLSCVAMCDIAAVIRGEILPEYSKERWLFLAMFTVLNQLDETIADALIKEHPKLAQAVVGVEGSKEREFFSAMLAHANKIRKEIATL